MLMKALAPAAARAAILVAAMALHATAAPAQALRESLASLITTQASDQVAAERSRDALVGLFSAELATLPLITGASGFLYELNPALGTVQRASDTFGAFFTERALRMGEGKALFGLVYQTASFSTLQGTDLREAGFPISAVRVEGESQPYGVDTLRLALETRTLTARAVYGVTDALDVLAVVPFMHTRFDGTRVSSSNGAHVFEVPREGSASGLGDATLGARYRVAGRGGRGVALGSDLRLPTGRAAHLLGTGALALRGQAIGTWEEGPIASSANVGLGVGGASSELFWNGAVTVAVTPRVTAVGEVLGRRLADVHRLEPVYAPHSTLAGVEAMRWVADETSALSIGYAVAGVRWNVTGSLLVGGHLLMRLTDAGLRARWTPSFTVDYDFTP
jgi:hypothetical protein